MSCTIKEISSACGVSATTVSQILNRGNGHMYKPSTCEQVLMTAKKLGYRPNTSARAMRTGRFGSVALLSSVKRQQLHLFPEILAGIQTIVNRAGIHLVLEATGLQAQDEADSTPKTLRELMVDGLLVNFPADSMAGLVGENGRVLGIPAMWIQVRQEHNAVYHDFYRAAQKAVLYLREHNHQRIACVDYSASRHHTAVDFRQGYLDAMRGAGLAPLAIMEQQRVPRGERISRIRSWLQKPDHASAVITSSHTTLLPIMMVAAQAGIRIPRDLSVIAVGNALMDDMGIAVTTLVVPNRTMGEVAVEMLLKRIEAPNRDLSSRALDLHLEPGETVAIHQVESKR